MDRSLSHNPAVVARHPYYAPSGEEYLVLSEIGASSWTADPRVATAFESMREATRAALRLSGEGRAFGLPLRAELGAHAAN
jgi:hypothetical protein